MAKRQPKLPGTTAEKPDESVSKALEEYVDACSEFASKRHEVTQKRAALLALMHDRKVTQLHDDELGVTVEILEKEKLVLTKDETDEAGDEADEHEAKNGAGAAA